MENMNWVDFGQLAGYVVTVYLFLTHIDRKDAASIAIHKECEQRIAAVAGESKKLAEKCLSAFQENTKAVAKFESALDRIEDKLR